MKPATQRALVTGLVVLALALRAPSVVTRSLWLDEAWLANFAVDGDVALPGQPDPGAVAPVPPLVLLLLRGVATVVGRSAAGMRALPLAASVAAVPLAFLLGRRWYGPAAGLAAAAAFACYPAAVTFGQELKPYAIDVLVVLALLLLGEAVVRRPDRARPWLLATLAEAVTPGLSFPATFVLPGVALVLLAACRTGRQRVTWAATQTLAVLAIAGWWTTVIAAQTGRPAVIGFWSRGFPPPGVLPALGWFGRQTAPVLAFLLDGPGWLFALVVLAGLLLAPRRVALQAALVLGVVFGAAALRLYPFAPGRTTLFLLPFLYLPLAGTAARLAAWSTGGAISNRAARLAALVGALVLLVLPARGALHPQKGLSWEETAPLIRRLAAERQPDDGVYVYSGAAPAFRFYHPELDSRIIVGGSHRGQPERYEDELKPLLVPGTRLWVLFSHVFENEALSIVSDLGIYGHQVDALVLPGASLHLFNVERSPKSVHHIRLPAPRLAP